MEANICYSEDSQIQNGSVSANITHEIKKMKHHRPILISDVDQLYGARNRLRQFVDEIRAWRFSAIRRDVIEHCNKVKMIPNQHLTYEKVEKMVKNRIEK